MNIQKIYREIAKLNGVTSEEVARDMQAAIDYAYTDITNDSVTRAYQRQVRREEEIPVTEEFLRYMTERVSI